MNEYSFTYTCGSCHGWFDGKTIGVPTDKNVEIVVKGFLCPRCYEKRKSSDRLKELGFI